MEERYRMHISCKGARYLEPRSILKSDKLFPKLLTIASFISCDLGKEQQSPRVLYARPGSKATFRH